MKIRSGFVSNSSSSSFTCDVCGRTDSGFDCGPEDCGMRKCQNDHYFCEDDEIQHEYTLEEKKACLIEKADKWGDDAYRMKRLNEVAAYTDAELESAWDDYVCDGVPPQSCPICSMGKISQNDRYHYLLWVLGKTTTEVDTAIKATFSSYDKFRDSIYKKE